MFNFKKSKYNNQEKVATATVVVFYEDDDLLISMSYSDFEILQNNRIKKLEHVVEEALILKAVLLSQLDGAHVIDLNKLCKRNLWLHRFNYLFADSLENSCCQIYDKSKKKFIFEINLVKSGEQTGSLCGRGGREFSINKKIILKTLDWIS
jgi:hypothetical protein